MTQSVQQPQIPQFSPEDANREATPAEVRQLQDAIHRVRKIIARFHDTRRKNNERMAGLRAAKLWPQQVQQIVHANRQPEVEAQAVEQLRQFLRVLRGHEPTRQEMQEGIPEGLEQQMGMGGLPFAVAAVAVSLATGVYSVFSYLDGHEERIAQQTATPLERGLRALSDNIWGVAAIGAVAGGVYVYHRGTTAIEYKRRKAGVAYLPSEEDEDEKPSLIEKAKTIVRNGLFPGEMPSSADKLSVQYDKLSEDEKERFVAMLNGEEEDDEEEECTGCPGDAGEESEVEENPDEPEEEDGEEAEEEAEDSSDEDEEQDEPEEQ